MIIIITDIYVLMFERILLIILHTVLLSVPLLITFAIVFNLAFFHPQEHSSPFAGSLVFFTALTDAADIDSINEPSVVYPAALLGLFHIIYTLVLLNILVRGSVDTRKVFRHNLKMTLLRSSLRSL